MIQLEVGMRINTTVITHYVIPVAEKHRLFLMVPNEYTTISVKMKNIRRHVD